MPGTPLGVGVLEASWSNIWTTSVGSIQCQGAAAPSSLRVELLGVSKLHNPYLHPRWISRPQDTWTPWSWLDPASLTPFFSGGEPWLQISRCFIRHTRLQTVSSAWWRSSAEEATEPYHLRKAETQFWGSQLGHTPDSHDAHVSQHHDTPIMSKAFSISGEISSTPDALPLGSCMTTSVTSSRDTNEPTTRDCRFHNECLEHVPILHNIPDISQNAQKALLEVKVEEPTDRFLHPLFVWVFWVFPAASHATWSKSPPGADQLTSLSLFSSKCSQHTATDQMNWQQ